MTVSSFAVMIAIGTIVLLLPWTSSANRSIGFVDALFIATSAICVTGLSPLDISREFSFFGQLAVLVMMQVGGLGLMTLTTSLYVWLGQRMPITDRLAIQETLLPSSAVPIKRILVYVVVYTLAVEFVGALLLAVYWSATARFASLSETIWNSVFHSVSAFTNGSIALFSNSLIDFRQDYFVIFVITTLIILGGLGFLVVYELKEFLRLSVVERSSGFRFSIQTKLTVVTTASLLILGTFLIYAFERNGVFADLTIPEAIANSYFFAVVPRTAGFNTAVMSDFGGAAALLMITLMFIGASPGSTGGGIKTTTFGLLVAYSFARFRGRTQLHIWNRTIPQSSIDRATAVVVASAATILIAAGLLMITESAGMRPEQSRALWMPVLFETISAFGTVGLTLDFTQLLSPAGKLILTFVMFIGRVGAITLALALSVNAKPEKFSFAEENVMIG